MNRALIAGLLCGAMSSADAGAQEYDRTKPAEVRVVGSEEATSLFMAVGEPAVVEDQSSPRVPVLLGVSRGTPVLFFLVPEQSTGSQPSESLRVPTLPTCEASGDRTCCEPQSQSIWIRAQAAAGVGWFATGASCLGDYFNEDGAEDPLAVLDEELADLLTELGDLDRVTLSYAGVGGDTRAFLLRSLASWPSDPCFEEQQSSCTSNQATSTKKCHRSWHYLFKRSNCHTNDLEKEWLLLNEECTCRS